jgi:membrane-associated protein
MDLSGLETALESFAGGPWVYLLVAGSIVGSAVFPPLPSDSMLVTAMGLAASGKLTLAWVGLATTLGGWLGDLLAYGLGRLLSRPVHRSIDHSERTRAALTWVKAHGDWGTGLIVVSRFIPGGTTAVGISAGIIAYPLRRFAAFSAIGASLWTGYGAAVGYAGAAIFPDSLGATLLIAMLIAMAVGVAATAIATRRRRRATQERQAGSEPSS